MYVCPSLVPRPRSAFHRLQYGKAGRAWYVSSREHYVIDKRPKFSERKSEVQPTTRSTLGVYNSRPPLAKYVWYVTSYLCSSCCSEPQFAHVQISPFYLLSILNVTHVRKHTRPSAFFRATESGTRAWERGYVFPCIPMKGTA